jgi:hypothetical protein
MFKKIASLAFVAIMGSYLYALDTIAIINYETKKVSESTGEQLADLMSVHLSSSGVLNVVERKKLKELMGEQELGQLGFSTPETSAKVQKLFGAQFFVQGKIFPIGEKIFITTELISTETSLKKTFLVQMSLDTNIDVLAETVANKCLETYANNGQEMKPQEVLSADKEVLKAVGNISWPVFAVDIPEKHMQALIPDPAAQTEMISLLQKCGAKVKEQSREVKSDLLEGGTKNIILPLDGCDILISGEGFSTFGAKRGDLFSCKARLELKAIDIKSGELLAVAADSVAGVDTSEALAAKKALQQTAEKIFRSFIPTVLKAWEKSRE